MTLPLSDQLSDNIAWGMVIILLLYYIVRLNRKNGYRNFKCIICQIDVRKINEGRFINVVFHDKFTWRNPLSFFEMKRFCSFEHLDQYLQSLIKIQTSTETVIDTPTLIPIDEPFESDGRTG